MVEVQRCVRKSLQGTWQTLKAWEEQQPSSYRPPLPVPLLVAIVCEARRFALSVRDSKHTDLWLTFSTLVLVGFFGMLRPGEICRLHVTLHCLTAGLSEVHMPW